MDRKINRIKKSLKTKFGGPCVTIYVNWDTFKKDEAGKKPDEKVRR